MPDNLPESIQAPLTLATGTNNAIAAQKGAPGFPNNGRIKVVALAIAAQTAGTVKIQSHTATGNATGVFILAANGQLVLPYHPDGWFTSNPGEGVDIVCSTTMGAAGTISYSID